VLYGNNNADDWIEAFNVHHVLQLHLNSPDFIDYIHRTDPLFASPEAVHQLLGGLENAIKLLFSRPVPMRRLATKAP
jgi:hypothetical protein